MISKRKEQNPIILRDVSKSYPKIAGIPGWMPFFGLRSSLNKPFLALKNISFSVRKGEAFGVIGQNGSGKTTLLKLLANVSAPTSGKVQVTGRVAPLIGLGIGFHPEMTGRENVYINGVLLGLKPVFLKRRLADIIEFAEIADFLETPLKYYSSGMQVRLAFAIIAQTDPEILLIDEVLSVGDIAFQRKCLDRIKEMKRSGTAIVFVSHNIFAVEGLCERAMLLDHGRAVISGPVVSVTTAYTNLIAEKSLPPRKHQRLTVQKSVGVSVDQLEFWQNQCKTQELTMGWDVEVKICLTFSRTVKSPGISFTFTRNDGQLCGSNRWQMTKKTIKGKIKYQFKILRLQLVPEAYRLHLLIWDDTFLEPFTHVVSVPFVVKAKDINVNRDWGIYVPEVEYAQHKTAR